MPQELNLNTSPYFDDFDIDKNYQKVLFNPAKPVQARELTTIQSILQNQIEQFGRHIFKDGSSVIDGQLSIDNPFPAIKIQPEFNGAPVSLYFNQLIGKKLRGNTSGVVAEVREVLSSADSTLNTYTLYLRYIQSGGADFSSRVFADGETLILEDPLTYGNFTVQSGQGICNTVTSNAATYGSSVSVTEGIYFISGYFIKVNPQRIFLDQYGINPSYRVGFDIVETIVTANDDLSLYDNAQGFSNYNAPGADRLKIELVLIKKEISDSDSNNFIEILRIENGTPQYFVQKTVYSLIRDELARRTADQSGDFYVKPFTLFVRESLNDKISTPTGVYFEGQTTVNGQSPTEDNVVYEIGPGKAYVNGYDVETISPKLLDVEKSRTTSTINDQVIRYNAGTLAVVNNTYGSASVGIGTTSILSLMDSRLGSNKAVAAGSTIGYARVYDFIPESNYIDNTSRFNLRLFDIQTFTIIELSTAITLTTPAFIRGKRSGASGYLHANVSSGTSLTLYEVSGDFLENEQIIINGDDDGRLIKNVRDYSASDVKSVFSSVGISTFNADFVLDKKSYISRPGTSFNITAENSGISTVSCGLSVNFATKLVPGDVIYYASPQFVGDVIYNKVQTVSLGGTNFTISPITTVSGICNGSLPTTNVVVNDVLKISSVFNSSDSSLLTPLPKNNISRLDLENNIITQRRIFTNQPYAANAITITITEPDLIFDSFDEDRFVITYADGSVEPMSIDKYSLNITGKELTFSGLTKAGVGVADVIATVKNLKPNSKIKKINKANSLIIRYSKNTSSGIGTTTLNDGLTYSNVYGVRVQDDQISLNVPDVIRILGVFESSTLADPSAPKIKLTSFTGPSNSNADYVIGEQIVGETSGAIAIVVSRNSTDIIEFVYQANTEFVLGEQIRGRTSEVKSIVIQQFLASNNIISSFNFDDGQRDSYYDYARLTRKRGAAEPKGKLKIIFENYVISSTDTGEFITVNSYSDSSYKLDIAAHRDTRLTDFIDIRPRVAPYTLNSRSPFEFYSRNFSNSGQYSKYSLAPDENLIISYSYYLPRIDKVFLNQDGTFEVIRGIPHEEATPPEVKSNALDIATIYLPAYVYDASDVLVSMTKHKRYRMADICLLENRIKKIEEFTILNSLESKTENFIIKDAETGLDRFKSGFFADNFSSQLYQDITNPEFRAATDQYNAILRPLHYTTNIDLQLGTEILEGLSNNFNPNADQNYPTDLGSDGVRKTGDLITLNYDEVLYTEQLSATRSENVTAFLVSYWEGSIELTPSIDTWIDEKFIITNSYNEVTTNVTRPDVNTTQTVNQQVTQKVAYVAPTYYSGGATPTSSPSTAAVNRQYNGIATGVIPSTNSYGTVNQNTGGYAPDLGTNRSTNSIGAAGVARALNDGYSLSEVQNWISRTGAILGPEARAKYGLTGRYP